MNLLKFFTVFVLLTVVVISGKTQNITIENNENKALFSAVEATGFTIELSIGEISTQQIKLKEGTFTQLTLAGYTPSLDYGSPQLPVLKRMMEFPADANYEIEIIDKSITTIQLADFNISNYIMPSQLPVPKIKNPIIDFQFNKTQYQHDANYGQSIIKIDRLGSMRATDLARLEISPISYNPVQNTLEIVHRLKVKIRIYGFDIEKIAQEKRAYASPYFQNISAQLINGNSYESKAIASTTTSYPVQYVIVADSMFKQSLQPFIKWKQKKGFKVIEAYMQNPAVGTSKASIKSYLNNLYSSATASNPAPSYVLLVGDVAQMPSWPGQTSSSHVSDLYYCEFTNDEFPEILYGRFSATDTAQLNIQIEKTIEYETYSMPDPSYLGKTVLIAGVDGSYGPVHGDGQIRYGVNEYFNASNQTACRSYLYVNGSGNKDAEIRQVIDSGVAIANYTAHGSPVGWADPAFEVSDIAAMTNKSKYPLMIGNACITNKFDNAVCFGEGLLRAKDKGAIGYIGASDNTYWDEDFYWAVGLGTPSANPTYVGTAAGLYDRMFHTHNEAFGDWAMSSAQYITAGNMAVTQSGSSSRYYWELYHVMGDPSLMAYQRIPDPITAVYAPFLQFGSATYTVSTNAPFSLVALSQNDSLIASAMADSAGVANLFIGTSTVLGSIDLVITGQNKAPYFATIIGGTPTAPYLALNQWIVDDSLTNNNGMADFGESVKLDMTFENLTQFITGYVTAKLQTTDTQVVITDSIGVLGIINGFDTASFNDLFSIQLAPNAEDQHLLRFTLDLSDASGTHWISYFSMRIYAPKFSIGTATISDISGGNGNGKIEGGESIKVQVPLHNVGSRNAYNITNNYVSGSAWATVGSSFMIDSLVSGSIDTAEFMVQFDAQLQDGQYINFIYEYVAQAYSGSKSIPQLIGQVDEDFETGDFSKFVWSSINNKDWEIDSLYTYEGLYSSRSSQNTANRDTSVMQVKMRVLTNDSISFYTKVSSEPGYDYLYFLIDGTVVGEWSGNHNWQRFAKEVDAGMHTFTWAYIKDYGIDQYLDASWVDYISFPPTDAWSSIDKNENPIINQIRLYPNPANTNTTVEFNLLQSQSISTQLYNQLGQKVGAEINHGQHYAGLQSFSLNIDGLSQGIYFVEIRIGKQQYFQKLIIE